MRDRRQKRLIRKRDRGVSLIETMAGFLILIPIALGAFDIATLVSTSQINEQQADSAARAASRAGCETQATENAELIISRFSTGSNIIQNIQVSDVEYNLAAGKVTVSTIMSVKVPVPIPFLPEYMNFTAVSMQPIVSIPAAQ